MASVAANALNVGDELCPVVKQAIDRTTLALFCGASNDHNPIHIDSDYAKAAGQKDVFAQGMLSMAYLGQVLTHWIPQQAIRRFSVRFCAITYLGDVLTNQAWVVEKLERNGESCVRLEMRTVNQDDDVKLKGEAIVALS